MSDQVEDGLRDPPTIKTEPNGITHDIPALLAAKPEPIDITDDGADDVPPKTEDPNRVAEARNRHEADLKKHHYEAPKADRIQDDWQVAYVWAFITKFEQVTRIRKLECLEDFERCLAEPVANRPDDVLEGILIRFLGNLKPGLRNLDCTNIQHHLSSYISDMLRDSPEFTVWDRPWAPNEEARGSCCNQTAERSELGRLRYPGEPLGERTKKNPIMQAEERGGGLFELDWRERARLLRQLVDWQLSHAESIRGIINKEYKTDSKTAKKNGVEGLETSIVTVPIGQDRDKARIWALDHSGRLYKSGNPFKRPCPLYTISADRAQLQTLLDRYNTHGAQKPAKLKGSGPKGKPSGAEVTAHRKAVKGIEDEKKLAERIEELIPLIEREEARVQKAKRRIQAAQELAQYAEVRSTRTRRTTKRVDYTYNEDADDFQGLMESPSFQSDEPVNKRQRHEVAGWEGSSTRGRPVIPGERRSARVSAKDQDNQENQEDQSSNVDDAPPSPDSIQRDRESSPVTLPAPISHPASSKERSVSVAVDGINGSNQDQTAKKRKNRMKGYAWVEEIVPFSQLKPKERELAEQLEREERAEKVRQEWEKAQAQKQAQAATSDTAPATVAGSSSPLSTSQGGVDMERDGSSRLSSVATPIWNDTKDASRFRMDIEVDS